MEAAINFQGSPIRFLVLAGDKVRENHEDATIRLMLKRERRKTAEQRPESPIILVTK